MVREQQVNDKIELKMQARKSIDRTDRSVQTNWREVQRLVDC